MAWSPCDCHNSTSKRPSSSPIRPYDSLICLMSFFRRTEEHQYGRSHFARKQRNVGPFHRTRPLRIVCVADLQPTHFPRWPHHHTMAWRPDQYAWRAIRRPQAHGTEWADESRSAGQDIERVGIREGECPAPEGGSGQGVDNGSGVAYHGVGVGFGKFDGRSLAA